MARYYVNVYCRDRDRKDKDRFKTEGGDMDRVRIKEEPVDGKLLCSCG